MHQHIEANSPQRTHQPAAVGLLGGGKQHIRYAFLGCFFTRMLTQSMGYFMTHDGGDFGVCQVQLANDSGIKTDFSAGGTKCI